MLNDIEQLNLRVDHLEAIVLELTKKYNAHTHGGVATGAGSTGATGSTADTTFTIREFIL